MAVKKPVAPRAGKLPTPAGARQWTEWFRSLPFGGAVGVVGAGLVLRFAPGILPEAWDPAAALALGCGVGIVLHRAVDWLFGWFFDPVRRHVLARWEAWLRLAKLERYERRGLIERKEARGIAAGIVRADVAGQVEGLPPSPSRRKSGS